MKTWLIFIWAFPSVNIQIPHILCFKYKRPMTLLNLSFLTKERLVFNEVEYVFILECTGMDGEKKIFVKVYV